MAAAMLACCAARHCEMINAWTCATVVVEGATG